MREDRERSHTEPLPFNVDEAQTRCAAFFSAYPEAQAVFLFGSRAQGRVRPSSDVDIAVWVDSTVPEPRRWDLLSDWILRLPEALEYPGEIDIVIANEAPPKLAWAIGQRPVVLWDAEPDLAMDAAFRMRQYYRDELPRLERRRQRLFDRIDRGEFGVRHRSR